MIVNLLSFISYFKNLAETHVQIEDFMFGDTGRILSDRMIEKFRSGGKYPVLFLETPFIKFIYNEGAPKIIFTSAFVLLSNIPGEKWDDQDAEMNRLFNIAIHILRQMEADRRDKKFLYKPNVGLDPLDNISIDNAIGWRCEFTIENHIDIASPEVCFVQSMWQPA